MRRGTSGVKAGASATSARRCRGGIHLPRALSCLHHSLITMGSSESQPTLAGKWPPSSSLDCTLTKWRITQALSKGPTTSLSLVCKLASRNPNIKGVKQDSNLQQVKASLASNDNRFKTFRTTLCCQMIRPHWSRQKQDGDPMARNHSKASSCLSSLSTACPRPVGDSNDSLHARPIAFNRDRVMWTPSAARSIPAMRHSHARRSSCG